MTVAVPTLMVVAAAAFGLLLALTPSSSDAEARTHQLSSAHLLVDTGDAVPSTFAAALVATEDSRFYAHHGVDTLGALRAVGGLLGLSAGSDGATLDQQLAPMTTDSSRLNWFTGEPLAQGRARASAPQMRSPVHG